jgi:PAS domain S-box-containing protein
MRGYVRSRWLHYGVTLGSPALAVLLVAAYRDFFLPAPFLLFLTAVVVSALIGGLRDGLLATAIGALASAYFLFAPFNTFQITNSADVVRLTLYVLIGLAVSCVIEAMHQAQRATKASEERAQRLLEAVRESEARFRLAIDAGQCGVWDWDLASNQTTWSDRHFEFFGVPAEKIGGHLEGFLKWVHPEDVGRVRAAMQRASANEGSFEVEFRIVRPDGGTRWLMCRGRTLTDGKRRPVRLLGATLDITARKAGEDSLREADQRKDEFLAILAHELRNPLAPIRTALHVLKTPQTPSDEAAAMREVIERQLEHLVRLVDDLLDVSRILRGKIELRPQTLTVADLFSRAVETVQPLLDESGHQFSVRLPGRPAHVWGDSVRLTQVLANLLNNAIKYTPRGGRLELLGELAASGANAEQVVIRVRDTGVGIAPTLLPRIFQLFVQADQSIARPQGGLGLGLTLVRQLVEMHEGTIEALSAGPNRGSEFVVRLPAVAVSVESVPVTRREKSDSSRGLRVLVVDDNVDAAESLALYLRLHGHEVAAVHEGEAALAAAGRFQPEIVLCDIGLPDISGHEVARRLRTNLPQLGAFLVAITGYGQERDQQLSREAGFDRHLVKPVDPLALRELLHQACAT